jgi:hypothetical protein
MGRKRLYPDNATRQREWQRKQREEELQVKIVEAQKTNATKETQNTEKFEQLASRWFSGRTIQEVKDAYQSYKSLYKALGTDILFQEIEHYLLPDTPLAHGINVERMELFLDTMENHVPCPICDYYYSHFEPKCPACELRLHDYKAWLSYRRSYND